MLKNVTLLSQLLQAIRLSVHNLHYAHLYFRQKIKIKKQKQTRTLFLATAPLFLGTVARQTFYKKNVVWKKHKNSLKKPKNRL